MSLKPGSRTAWSCAVALAWPSWALAAAPEDTLELTTKLIGLIFLVFVLAVVAAVYWMKSSDPRETPLKRIFARTDAVHCVGPGTLVAECARLMAAKRIGAVLVLDDGRITGIFTERDALDRVLACGLDPNGIKVAEVMTRSPVCVAPDTSVSAAMELVTTRRFRHLPVVDQGRLVGVVSSGDLTRWLVKERLPQAQQRLQQPALIA